MDSDDSTPHILIVDDDPAITSLLSHLLEANRYRVTAINDSEEALQFFLLHHQKIDLVITDQSMPKLTGIELARSMLELDARLPIILCSGASELISDQSTEVENISQLIQKPYKGNELIQAIDRHIHLQATC